MRPQPHPRLYCEKPLYAEAFIELNREQSHYLLNVLRLTTGDEVLIFNGIDGEWRAVLDHVAKKTAHLKCLEQTRPQEPRPNLTLAFAPIKRARIDFIAEKATELGAGILQPVMTEYTQMSRVNTERMTANAIEAAEQTGRTTIPEIRKALTLGTWLQAWPDAQPIIFCDETQSPDHGMPEQIAKGNLNHGDSTAILIGPEGGFSPRERQEIARHKNLYRISLGGYILRADTAMLAALAIWQASR